MKLVWIILDGFGRRGERKGNAIAHAHMPFMQSLVGYPQTTLRACGKAVGLPQGAMGNSEVGHLNLGAGRVVEQDSVRINRMITDGSFFRHTVLQEVFSRERVHLYGLLSDQPVHGYVHHLLALIRLAKKKKVETFVHLFTDGRDMAPRSCLPLVAQVEKACRNSCVRIATVGGRYFGMDRDGRLARTRKAFGAIVKGRGKSFTSAAQGIRAAYKRRESDEFIVPFVVEGYSGAKGDDGFFSWNFRPDRARQITYMLLEKKHVVASMTSYNPTRKICPVVVAQNFVENTFPSVVSSLGMRQLHVAETEKYAHVTYFFNGGRERKFRGETRVLVPSKKVGKYDRTPAMRAWEISTEIQKGLGKYDFIVANFANADMVGHTGNFAATVRSLKILDQCLLDVVSEARTKDYTVCITADHGNCEDMRGSGKTKHTFNKVPLFLITEKKGRLVPGVLGDVAPTLLHLFGLRIPKNMRGKVLWRE